VKKNRNKWITAVVFVCIMIVTFGFSEQNARNRIEGNSLYIHNNDSVKLNKPSEISPDKALSNDVFLLASYGYQKLNAAKKIAKPILTIVDFSKPSTEKRLFIIDMRTGKLLVHSLVAHGKNSGEKVATRFSNTESSYQSSLGFYITGNTYQGGNGYSLKLKGMEAGFNDKAEQRAIVMHGADYVSEYAIKNLGRLGRSWGCPAVSQQEHKMIIDLIKQGSCLFIYAPQQQYISSSNLLKDITLSNTFF
jgi:hypothetical protein